MFFKLPLRYSCKRYSRKRQRGITLLATISMIVLFMLLGTAFVMFSARFMQTSKYQALEIEHGGDDSQTILRRTLMTLLRDPNLDDSTSPLRGHSLLADMYGYGVRCRISGGAVYNDVGHGQLIEVAVNYMEGILGNDPITPLPTETNFFAGQVWTFTSGTAKDISTRIVGYEVRRLAPGQPLQGIFYLLPNWNEVGSANLFTGLNDGDIAIINRAPFSGLGAGPSSIPAPPPGDFSQNRNIAGNKQAPLFAPSTGDASAQILSPLRPFKAGLPRFDPSRIDLINGYLGTGPNESYDAPDFQNMFLAMEFLNGSNLPGFPTVIPSFHRAELNAHIVNNAAAYQIPMQTIAGTDYYDYRSISLRPAALRQFVDPNVWFAGGATDLQGLNAPPEVDTDGDGINDSVWIDIGLPIQTGADGRQYKPLVAVKIIDMDGKLNANAHGNLYDALFAANGGRFGATNPNPLLGILTAPNTPNTAFNNQFNPGVGMGPPEISFRDLLSGPQYLALVNSRHSVDGVPGTVGRDTWSQNKLFGHPGARVGNFYQTGLDMSGRYVNGFSGDNAAFNFGIPVSMPMFDFPVLTNEVNESAYEMVHNDSHYGSGTAAADIPFTAKELERILRRNDHDAKILPNRLYNLLGAPNAPGDANVFTTASFETPSTPRNLWSKLNELLTINGFPAATQQRDVQILNSLAWELGRRLPMDINRPFGNGLDDPGGAGNGVVDEYGDGANNDGNQNQVLVEAPGGTSYGNPIADLDSDGAAPAGETYRARARFARHLYTLVLTATVGEDGVNDGIVNQQCLPLVDLNNDGNRDVLDIEVIAQWCINVVDFRDSDSICTPFVYDTNPFNGWNIDENLSNPDATGERRVVFGVERPELLLTESIVLHDRRTEDLSIGGSTDPHFDQRLIPRGAAFVELYNPHVKDGNNQRLPAELYDNIGVDLDRVTAGNGSPVWRMVFVKDGSRTLDPDDPDPANAIPASDIVRTLYFADPTISGVDVTNKARWTQLAVGSLPPGRHAVIGSSSIERDQGGGIVWYQTPLGRRTTAADGDANTLLLDNTRSIILVPAADQVIIKDWNGTDIVDEVRNDVLAVAMDSPRSFELSEPDNGYTIVGTTTDVGDGPAMDVPVDEPLDLNDPVLMKTGNTQDYRVVHLQRLANPFADFDALTNPYLTIDSLSMDLMTYNGTEDDSAVVTVDAQRELRTVERGWSENAPAPKGADRMQTNRMAARNLWRTEPLGQPLDPQAEIGTDDHFFSFYFRQQSLGQINRWYRHNPEPWQPAPPNVAANQEVVAFPDLGWNNRPYVSEQELTLVPFARSSQYLDGFALMDLRNPFGNTLPTPYAMTPRPFQHLLNFYSTSATSQRSPNLYRIFDFVEVPSRFTGTETYLNPYRDPMDMTPPMPPQTFYGVVTQINGGMVPDALFGLNPPFNSVSEYRYPGKVNINTISDPRVWEAVMGPLVDNNDDYESAIRFVGRTPNDLNVSYTFARQHMSFAQLEAARTRGGGANVGTYFATPFRSAISSNYVPEVYNGSNWTGALVRNGVDGTLLRPDQTNNLPLFRTISNFPHNNSARNAPSSYLARTRLDNLVTTRSNVFAIWITVGRFEVSAEGILGGELGVETGEIERHRGFYMVDRSIPVAFEPGQDHNVERMIISESTIE